MKTPIFAALIFLMFFLGGCASHPLGIPDNEWQEMTIEERNAARSEQARITEANRQRQAEERRERIAAREEEQRQLERLRANASYGDVVQCTLSAGRAVYAGDWHQAQNVSVEIHRTEDRRQVRIPQADRPSRAQTLHMGFDGMNVKVCRWYNRDCDTLSATQRDFERGVSKQVSVNGFYEGALRCNIPRTREPYRIIR